MKQNNTNNSTVYDDVFRTMEVRCPKLMIPLINEVFSENYRQDYINSCTPDTMDIKANMSITPGMHRVIVIKIGNYSLDELFDKQLWILLPFYIFNYESRFAEYETDANLRKEMLSEFKLIIEHLETLELNKEINSWERSVLLSLTRRVIRKITVNNDNIRKELINIMGGKVLYDTEMDIAWRKGLKKGRSEGRLETLFSLYEDGFLTEEMLLSRAEKEGILDMVQKRLAQY